MRLPCWNEFEEKLSGFEEKAQKIIKDFREGHPILDKIVTQAIPLLPPPFNAIAEQIHSLGDGSEEEKTDQILQYLVDIKNQGPKHYEVIAYKIDGVLRGIDDLQSLGKNQNRILKTIQDTLITGLDEVDQKIDGLKDDIKGVQIAVDDIGKDVKKINRKQDIQIKKQDELKSIIQNGSSLDVLNFEKNSINEIEDLLDFSEVDWEKAKENIQKTQYDPKINLNANAHAVLTKLDQIADVFNNSNVSKGTRNRFERYFKIGSALIHWQTDRGFGWNLEKKYSELFKYLKEENIDSAFSLVYLLPEHLRWLDVEVHLHKMPACVLNEKNEICNKESYDCLKCEHEKNWGHFKECKLIEMGENKGMCRCVHKKIREKSSLE